MYPISEVTNTLQEFGVVHHHFDKVYIQDPWVLRDLTVWQIGDLCCAPGYHIRPHDQFCYEISYIEQGCALFKQDEDWYTLMPGQLFLGRMGSVHEILAMGDGVMRMFYLGFTINCPSHPETPFDEIIKLWGSLNVPVIRDTYSVRNIYLQMFTEYMNREAFSPFFMETLLAQIIILTSRSAQGIHAHPYSPAGDSKDKRLLSHMLAEIEKNYMEIEDLQYFAQKLGYSYSHLSHTFSEAMGMSMHEYIDKRRFERAKRLLDERVSVTEVSQSMGYLSIHAFSKAFKKRFNIPPSTYQAQKLEMDK